jgi:phosphatidylglycerol lysyltransferase
LPKKTNALMQNMADPSCSETDHPQVQSTIGPVRRIVLPLLSLALFLIAVAASYHILQEISLAQLLAQLNKLSNTQLAAAVLCTAGSYAVLAGYDWSALSYIGRRIPFRTVALATFCGCAIANAIGFNAISGASVRYRVYVSAGLNSFDVARVTLFGMIAFGIGTSVVAAAALVVHPELFAGFFRIPQSSVKNTGVLGLVAFAAFVTLSFGRRSPVRIGPWQFRVPSGRLTLTQFVISVADIILASTCLYVLIPEPAVPFLGFVAVYAVGIVAGMVSHVPGGLGVFESVILLAFRYSIPPESLAAGLLVYRAIYYLAPLMLAALTLATREAMERIAPVPKPK